MQEKEPSSHKKAINTARASDEKSAPPDTTDGAAPLEAEGTPDARSDSSGTVDRPAHALSADLETFLNKVMEEALQAGRESERSPNIPGSGAPTQGTMPAASQGIDPPSFPPTSASTHAANQAPETSHPPRRRGWRILQEIAIQIVGTDANGKDFFVPSKTVDLSSHGAKILLNRDLVPDQEVCVCRPDNGKECHARVVGLFYKAPEGHAYGIEFLLPDAGFWNISFLPAPGFV